jgi:hypothetical protein
MRGDTQLQRAIRLERGAIRVIHPAQLGEADLANNHFRHGMTKPFALKSAEVDYFLVT